MNPLLENQCAQLTDRHSEHILDELVETVETARKSNIYIETTLTYRKWGIFKRITGGLGSGFVFKQDDNYYYALTNKHVIDKKDADEAEYTVRLYSGQEVNGSVVAESDTFDLAVMRFPLSGENLPLTTIPNEKDIPIDLFVLVIGNPSGLQNVVTPAKIIGYGPYLKGIDYSVFVLDYRMDAQGNSGGAVIDRTGELVGILTWQAMDSDQKFVIPLPLITSFLQSIE